MQSKQPSGARTRSWRERWSLHFPLLLEGDAAASRRSSFRAREFAADAGSSSDRNGFTVRGCNTYLGGDTPDANVCDQREVP